MLADKTSHFFLFGIGDPSPIHFVRRRRHGCLTPASGFLQKMVGMGASVCLPGWFGWLLPPIASLGHGTGPKLSRLSSLYTHQRDKAPGQESRADDQ